MACSAAPRGRRPRSRPRCTAARPGRPYDACYHSACDDINNLNPAALNELGDAAAHAVYTLALTKTGFFPDGSLRAAKKAAPVFDYKGSHAIR